MSELMTVLLAAFEQEEADRILELLGKNEALRLLGHASDPTEVVQLTVSTQPDVLLIRESDRMSWAEVCSFIGLACPDTRVVLMAREVDHGLRDEAMLLGVRQVLAIHDGIEAIPVVLRRIEALEEVRASEEFHAATDPEKYARLISLSGAKGGVGKTTVTVNLGVTLARKNIGPVVIWDAYSQFGDVDTIMGLAPSRTLGEIADAGIEVDDDFILDHVLHHESGADVLLTSDKPLPLDAIGEPFVDRVIKALRKRYRFVVADTPPSTSPVSSLIFARCWRLLVVTTLKDVTSVTDAIKLINMVLPLHVRPDALAVIVNRISRGDSVKEKEVESLIGKSIIAAIPEDPQVAQSNNMGRPICSANPRSPASRAIELLADRIIEEASTFHRPQP